ncbi:MAG: Homoserine dehydrogenase [Bacteroidia bacterium]|nr:Homoserine dehydrogenase [Bacteroidia bacterium]
MISKLKIGLFGFGCVGQGLYDVLSKSSGIKADIIKICVKDRSKSRKLPMELFTYDKNDILNNSEINLVVELIDDADEAFNIVKAAMTSGKSVVTANKKMVANHLSELVELQSKHNVSLLYEASSCGSIPIIRTLEEYYDNELLYSVSGIFNGSSNYILSKIFNENLDYATALKQAQDLGFAESNPLLDVGGFDAKFKLTIIAAHAYGLFIHPDDILNLGIQNLSLDDIDYARKNGKKIKLVNVARKLNDHEITIHTMPTFVAPHQYLYFVENEYNGVIVEAAFSDKQFYLGKGAGGHPTGSAVLSDISAVTYDYKYAYHKASQDKKLKYSKNVLLEVYVRYSSDEERNLVPFESISEEGKGYSIGTVRLENLLNKNAELLSSKLFICNTGKNIPMLALQVNEPEKAAAH